MAEGSNRAFAVANGLAAAMFLVSAALQYNDPDPLRWAAMYGAGAAACLLHGRVRWHRALALVVALCALGWAASQLGILPRLAIGDLFKSMKAETPAIEESREFLGLLLVGGWAVFLTIRRPSSPHNRD